MLYDFLAAGALADPLSDSIQKCFLF